MIKIQLDGERVWAEKLTENTARIANIPLDERCNLNDVVEFSGEQNTYVKTVEQKSKTLFCRYDTSEGVESYKKLYTHFEDNKIGVEGAIPGIAALAIPMDMEFERFVEIAQACPVANGPVEGGEDDTE